MELLAVIAALEALTKINLSITVYSDSQYVVKAVKEGWLNNWMRTDFQGRQKKQGSVETIFFPFAKNTTYSLAG